MEPAISTSSWLMTTGQFEGALRFPVATAKYMERLTWWNVNALPIYPEPGGRAWSPPTVLLLIL